MPPWDKCFLGHTLLDVSVYGDQGTRSARHGNNRRNSLCGMSLTSLPSILHAYVGEKVTPRSYINPSGDHSFPPCLVKFVPTALRPPQCALSCMTPEAEHDTSPITNDMFSNVDLTFTGSIALCSLDSDKLPSEGSSAAPSCCSNRVASNDASPPGRTVMVNPERDHEASSHSPSACSATTPCPTTESHRRTSDLLDLVPRSDHESEGDGGTSLSGESSSVLISRKSSAVWLLPLSLVSSRTSTRSPVFEHSVAAAPKVSGKVRADSRAKESYTHISFDGRQDVSKDGTFVPSPLQEHGRAALARTATSDATFQHIRLEDVTIGPLIGTGRTGTVWSALVNTTGQQVACKHIPSQFVVCAEAELTTLERLPRHPSIIAYFGHTSIWVDGENIAGKCWDSGLVIIMEYMPCQSVRSALDQFGAFDLEQVRSVTAKICDGLCVLHKHGICHRDLKSLNVLLGRDGEAKLSDFGAAKKTRSIGPDDLSFLTCEDISRQNSIASIASLAGTALWMAPEVIRGGGYHRAPDIWGLGCVVYEMAFNEYPWERLHFDNEFAALAVIGFEDVSPLQGCHRERVDPDLWEFLDLCFQRDPANRPSAAELLETPFLQGTDMAVLYDVSSPQHMVSFSGRAARDPSNSTRPTDHLVLGLFDSGHMDSCPAFGHFDSSQRAGDLPFTPVNSKGSGVTCHTVTSRCHSVFSKLFGTPKSLRMSYECEKKTRRHSLLRHLFRKPKRLQTSFYCAKKMNRVAVQDLRTNRPEPCCCIA